MTEPDDLLAAEFALGLLSPDEEAATRARAVRDPAFAAAVEAWRERLSALALELDPETPPDRVRARIEAAIDARTAGSRQRTGPASRPTSLVAWQLAAAALGAIALLEFGLLVMDLSPDPAPEEVVVTLPEAEPLVAALVPSDAQAPVIVSLDVPQGVLRVDPSQITTDGRAVQLWLLPADGGDPVSLGVLVPDADNTLRLELGPLASGALPSLAISLEPPGGSPTGLPTGPIVASGPVERL